MDEQCVATRGMRWGVRLGLAGVVALAGASAPVAWSPLVYAQSGVGTPPRGRVLAPEATVGSSRKEATSLPPGIVAGSVGTMSGSVSVGPTGGFGWTTPLNAVPGVGGMTPSLGISYGGSGYGGLGLGFSLDAGNDSINRCARTRGQDGEAARIAWTSSDALCLGGARLEAVKGAHGGDGTEYRVQTAPDTRVVAVGASTDPLSGFAVYTPDGRVTHYGAVPGLAWTQESLQWAQVDGTKVPFAWHASRVIDARTQNQLAYRYAGEAAAGDGEITPRDHRLVTLAYGMNPQGGTDFTRQVTFDYAPVQAVLGEPQAWEPAQAWVQQGYVSGQSYTRWQVLRRVHMQVRRDDGQWEETRHYRLGYEAVPAVATQAPSSPDRVRLAALQECGGAAVISTAPGNQGVDLTPCFWPTRFEWSSLTNEPNDAAEALTPMPGYAWDGASFYPLPPADQLETTVYQRPVVQLMGDFDGDYDSDMLVMPETVNSDALNLSSWDYWETAPDVHGPAPTNVAAWELLPWHSRVGAVVPATGALQVYGGVDVLSPRPPSAVKTGRDVDVKAPPIAFTVNYDGTGGMDVLMGTPIHELAGALGDTPNGLGSETTIDRHLGVSEGDPCWPLTADMLQTCTEQRLTKSRADYTGHPGFMEDLVVLRLRRQEPGSNGKPGIAHFEQTSLHYPGRQPVFWMQALDMDGNGLTDVIFCKADADYAAVAGKKLPMFYGPGDTAVNWVSGHLHYGLNVPGQGIDLSDGGTAAQLPGTGAKQPVPCHAKDSYLVLDLDGDGTQSLLHKPHPHAGKTTLAQIAPTVPAGEVQDPQPRDAGQATLTNYWSKLLKHVWSEQALGQTYYSALTYRSGAVVQSATNLPVEQFMLWQQGGAANTTRRYSTHQGIAAGADEDAGPAYSFDEQAPNTELPAPITDWGSPDAPMVGGPSNVRIGDVNGDNLDDVLMVDQLQCAWLQVPSDPADALLPHSEACSYRSVLEWGHELIEQTYEKLAVLTYLNRGDGTFELAPGGGLQLWDTNMPSEQHRQVLETLFVKGIGAIELNALYNEAWTAATTATRTWRMEFGHSFMGDGNGDGLADLGYLKLAFAPDGGWLANAGMMSGNYTIKPSWRLARHGGALAEVDTPMGVDIDTLVDWSLPTGWPAWQPGSADLYGPVTHWADANGSAATVGPYEQQAYGIGARLMVLDVNADGQDETAFLDFVRGQYKLAGPQALEGEDEPQPHLLTAVVDGLGARTEVDYAPQWTLTTPSTPWTQADIELAYPLLRRPSVAAAVSTLRTDTGLHEDDARVYATTRYRYGKTTLDVGRGISLGIERNGSEQRVVTPSGIVTRKRLSRYDVTPAYDETFKAYPLAGSLLSETTLIANSQDATVSLGHSGQRHSAHPGKVGPTWRRQLDRRTVSSYDVGSDVPDDAAQLLWLCLSEADDGPADCTLGNEASYQPLATSTTVLEYDTDGYGRVTKETVTSLVDAADANGDPITSTTVTQRDYEHRDPATLGGVAPYLLGLARTERVTHEPAPSAGKTQHTVAHEYFFNGLLKATTVEPDPDRLQYRFITAYTYDGFGNVHTQKVSADGHPDNMTTYGYSASGAYPTSVTNALGHTATTQWFESCGTAEHVTNALGQTQVNDIDVFCRARGGQLFYGDAPLTRKSTISFEEWQPDAAENYPDREVLVTTAVDGGAAHYTITNRVGQTLVQQGPGFGFEVYTQTRYDALGRIIEVSPPTKVGEQPVGWTTTTYDRQGRVRTLTKPDGTQQSTDYARYVTTATNEIGVSGSSEINALGQVVKVMPPPDPDHPDQDTSMCYSYGAFGTLAEAAPCTPTVAKGPTTLEYDDYGRLIRSEDAQAGVRITRYDALGRVDESEDALGQVTKMHYDVLGRLKQRTQAYGTADAKSATWDYDTLAPGVLSQAVNADGTVIDQPLLDDYNRPIGATTTIHGRAYTQRLSYDAWGRVASQTYPSLSFLAPVVTWTEYNDLDQVIGLSYQGTTLWQPIKADVWGHLTEQHFGALPDTPTVVATAAYETLTGRLEDARVFRRSWAQDPPNDQLIEHFTYNWYPDGMIRMRIQPSLTEPGKEQADQFHYTPRGELDQWTTIGANQAVKHYAMDYDGFGNITQSPTGKYSYFAEKLLLIDGPLGEIGYGSYTGNGQVEKRTHAGRSTTLHYNALDQLSRIEAPGVDQTITYDAGGAKVYVKDEKNGRETYYLGAYQEERGGALGHTVVGRYALGAAHLTRTWQKDLSYSDQLAFTPPADHLGSTTLVTDAQGNVLDRRAYDPWGNEREPGNWLAYKVAPIDDTKLPVTGYTGHHERRQFGVTTPGIGGLIDMGARYYDPAAMRFLQPDTLIPDVFSPTDWNRFAYVNNSPTMHADPTGHAAQQANNEESCNRACQSIRDAVEGLNDFFVGSVGGGGFGNGGMPNAPTGEPSDGPLSSLYAAREKIKGAIATTRETAKAMSNITEAEVAQYEHGIMEKKYRMALLQFRAEGRTPPFNNLSEFKKWWRNAPENVLKRADGVYLENTAAEGEGVLTALTGSGRFGTNATGSGGVRTGLSTGRRLLNAIFGLRKARKTMDLSKAHIDFELTHTSNAGAHGHVIADGKIVGSLVVDSERVMISLDAKQATPTNVLSIWGDGVFRDATSPGVTRVSLNVTSSDATQIRAIVSALDNIPRGILTSFRGATESTRVQTHTFLGTNGRDVSYGVEISWRLE